MHDAKHDTKALLQKIAALRIRLDQAQHASGPPVAESQTAIALEEKAHEGTWHHTLLTGVTLAEAPAERPTTALPPRLTARAARMLKQGRELLHELRVLADESSLPPDPVDPLTSLHMETCSMLDAVMRSLPSMPEGPGAQLRLCEGLEATLGAVRERLGILVAAIDQRGGDMHLLDTLAELLDRLASGAKVEATGFQALARQIHLDARLNQPLRFFHALATEPARYNAAHSLIVAQVLARIMLHEAPSADTLEEALLAALVHDAGMVRLPVSLLAQSDPLTGEQRRQMELHTAVGAQLVSRAFPGSSLAFQAAQDHHERVDGTGYPAAKRDEQLSSFVKLLAVCDVYAALCSHRPHRYSQETRAALTDVLLLADQGALDKTQAEKLLHISFYPVGSVVELNDGAVAVVVGVNSGQQGLLHPAKPIVSFLLESDGRTLAVPKVLDLLHEENRCILRTLPAEERRRLLAKKYPALI